jgi:hypothetical protein
VSIYPIKFQWNGSLQINFVKYFAAAILPDIKLMGKESVNLILGQVAKMKQLNFGRNKEV